MLLLKDKKQLSHYFRVQTAAAGGMYTVFRLLKRDVLFCIFYMLHQALS